MAATRCSNGWTYCFAHAGFTLETIRSRPERRWRGIPFDASAPTARAYDINLTKLNLSERQAAICVNLPDAVRSGFGALARKRKVGRRLLLRRLRFVFKTVKAGLPQPCTLKLKQRLQCLVDRAVGHG